MTQIKTQEFWVPISVYQRSFAAECLSNYYAFPEGDITLNILCVGLGFRVLPRCIFICVSVYDNIVIAGCSFPAADRVRFGWLKIFGINRVFWKIVVSFDDDRVVAFC